MAGLEHGARIADRYIVQGRLGSGGMATVYECVDSRQGDAVAVKLLHHHLLVDNEEIVRRFRREADVMAHLCEPTPHPNIVALRERIERDDQMAIVMELVGDGTALSELLPELSEPMSEDRAVEIMVGVLAGIGFAHERGIVHRDLKPSNILLARDESGGWVPKISDFGIAKWAERPGDPGLKGQMTTLTQTQSMFGSPAYMAPELFDSAAAASASSDLYALGVVLHEMLIGEPPFVVDSMPSHVMRVSTQPAPSPRRVRPELSGDVERAIAIALAKHPEERMQSAEAFAAVLQGRGAGAANVGDVDPTRFGHEYRVDRRIGRGPVATVYACTDETLDVPVAIKMLRGGDPERRERFLEVARGQAPLHQGRPHRGIVAIRHIINEDDVTALVAEHVEGVPLDRYVAEARPDLAGVLRLAGEAASALAHAHGVGVVHRNLKPTNVLVTWTPSEVARRHRPRAKLSDFGMDQVGARSNGRGRRARPIAMIPPEVAAGAEPDEKGDVYTLGVLLLLAVRGRLPSDIASGREGAGQLQALIADVPGEAQTLLTKMLAVEPEMRPAASEVREMIGDVLRNMTGEGLDEPVSPEELFDLGEPPRRRSAALWIAIVALFAAAGGAAWFLSSSSGEGEAAQTPATNTPDESDADETGAASHETTASDTPSDPEVRDVGDEVAQFLASRGNEVTSCLQEAFQHERASELESASGVLAVDIVVDGEGEVKRVDIVEDSLAIIELGPCMAERIKGWRFPASGREETWTKKWFF